MNKLYETLQEFQDFYEYGGCLSFELKNFYEQYLGRKLKRILNEVTSKNVYEAMAFNKYKRKLAVIERFENFQNTFKRIAEFDWNLNKNGNKIPIPNYMTHLCNKEGVPCTKEEFKKELLEFEFDEQSLAKKLLDNFLSMFRNSGWLNLEKLPKEY